MSENKKLLLIAFHCPPFQGSTGVTRTLAFAKYLREYGWDVTLLTTTVNAYTEIRRENLSQIPAHVRIVRAPALDAQRHLSILGRYPWWLASPDRWRSWFLPAVMRASLLIGAWRPHAIMSTYPIATAHQIGATLAKLFKLPWIADMRDPMAQDGYPSDPRIHRAFERIENKIFQRAARVLVTTQGAANLYRERFKEYPSERITLLPNGFDSEMFGTAPASIARDGATRPLKFLHSGILYPSERDPTQFFAALAELRAAGMLAANQVEFCFRAPGNEAAYSAQLHAHGIADLVKLLPPIPYGEALAEMTTSDAFMLFQASNCNDQIPAKLYEYLYAQKPILGLTDFTGETARLMMSVGSDRIANLHDAGSIKTVLMEFIRSVRDGAAPIPARALIERFSRRQLTGSLAELLNAVSEPQIRSE